MIFIVKAECFRCGQPLFVYPGTDSRVAGTGDLFLQVTSDGVLQAQAQCKNIMACNDWLADHGPPA